MAGHDARRLALSEATFRELNERLAEHDHQAGYGSLEMEFVCECPEAACGRHLRLSADRWSAIHRDACTFVVAPGHEAAPWIEEVVERGDGYWLVRKVGEAGVTAERIARGA
jgi:hypothetical protein